MILHNLLGSLPRDKRAKDAKEERRRREGGIIKKGRKRGETCHAGGSENNSNRETWGK